MVDMSLVALFVAFGRLVEGVTVEFAADLMKRQRKINRFPGLTRAKAARHVARASEDIVAVLGNELGDVPDNEVRAAMEAVHASIEAVAPIQITDVLATDLDPANLEAQVRERSAVVLDTARLGEPGRQIYDRVLRRTCELIVRAVRLVPGFETHLQLDIHKKVGEHGRILDEMRRRQRIGPVDDDFEARYLDQVTEALGGLELFGLSGGHAPRFHALEQGYVSPAVARTGGQSLGADDELTGAGVEVSSGLAERRRVLLRGDAGAGKTTLLQWLAVSSRPGTPQTASWGSTVPFFVPLREFSSEPLPETEALPATVAAAIAAEKPPDWATEQFRAGRALVLLDGVDELEKSRRLEVRDWLRALLTAYPDTRVVVSARPFAIPEDWLDEYGFVTFDLLPLSPEGIGSFLAKWHEAARQEHPFEEELTDWLDECEAKLTELVETQLELRRLASNPLLCGLLCALHRERNMDLPRDRKGLYDAALGWLLERWDAERGIKVEGWPSLSREEQTVLLQRFAYSMVKNHELVVSRTEAAERIRHAMRGLRSQDDDEPASLEVLERTVFQRTLERTGLLREPSPDQVQFVHRTFRDYLAAKEVVDSRDLRLLLDNAHLDQWHDVVVNAVAHARPDERGLLLRQLLDGNDAARSDPRLGNRLRLIAAACLPYADVLAGDSRQTRQMVRQAAKELIPPATLDEAEVLAKAGAFVLDLLPGPEGLSAHEAACVIRTAAMIGGPGVRERLAEFATISESKVVDELLRAWRRWRDPADYARTVLADVDFGDRRVEVRGWSRVECLPQLQHLTNVVCYGDFADLTPLAAVPRLRRLELVQNEMVKHIRPLTRSRTLRTLVLTAGCQFLRDLSPLADTTIDQVVLHLVRADLGTLQGDQLRRLVIRDQRIDDGLHPLRDDLPLRELVIDNLPRKRNLQGIERWQQLEQVSVKGVPRSEEVDALASLPALRRLTIRQPDAITDLPRLGALPVLAELVVEEVAERDIDAVTAALDGLRDGGVDIRINGRSLGRRPGDAPPGIWRAS